MVIKFHLPAPLAAILGVPPAQQFAHFSARQDNHLAEISLGWPKIFTSDVLALDDQSSDRAVGRLGKVLGVGKAPAILAAHFDGENGRRRMDQEYTCLVQPAPRKGNSRCGPLG